METARMPRFRTGFIAVLLLLALVVLHWGYSRKVASGSTRAIPVPHEAVLRLEPHWLDSPRTIHRPGTPMDVCRILMSCFPVSGNFSTFEICNSNLGLILQNYDSAFFVETENGVDRVVGFISGYAHTVRKDVDIILIYNVCIDEERRSRGYAQKLVPAFIQALAEKYNIKGKDERPAALALDVDMTHPMAAQAFSLYVKLGFVRYMTPCHSVSRTVSRIDWIRAMAPDWRPPYTYPLNAIMKNADDYVKMMSQSLDWGENTHFCMYMRLGDKLGGTEKRDGLVERGLKIQAAVQKALK